MNEVKDRGPIDNKQITPSLYRKITRLNLLSPGHSRKGKCFAYTHYTLPCQSHVSSPSFKNRIKHAFNGSQKYINCPLCRWSSIPLSPSLWKTEPQQSSPPMGLFLQQMLCYGGHISLLFSLRFHDYNVLPAKFNRTGESAKAPAPAPLYQIPHNIIHTCTIYSINACTLFLFHQQSNHRVRGSSIRRVRTNDL